MSHVVSPLPCVLCVPVVLDLLSRLPAGDPAQRPVVYRFVRAVVRSVRLAWVRLCGTSADSSDVAPDDAQAHDVVDEWLSRLMSFCACLVEHCTVSLSCSPVIKLLLM